MSALSVPPESSRGFLSRYADELAALAQGLETLQSTLSDTNTRSAGSVEGRQALDALTQRAQALADVARRMPGLEALSDKNIGLLIASVKLADVAARLAGQQPSVKSAPAGDVELF